MAGMFHASLAETRRSISPWITLGQAISESQIAPEYRGNTRCAAKKGGHPAQHQGKQQA
jgi:hypothetical protein